MHNWLDGLPLNPLPSLLASADQALLFFVRRDLLDKDPGPVQALWERPFAARILRKQRANGAWRYPGQGPGRRDLPVRNLLLQANPGLCVRVRQRPGNPRAGRPAGPASCRFP